MYKQVASRMLPFTAPIPSYQRQIKPTQSLIRSVTEVIITTAKPGIIISKQGTIIPSGEDSSMPMAT